MNENNDLLVYYTVVENMDTYGYGFTCTLYSLLFVFQTPRGNLYTPVQEPIDAFKIRLISENYINQYTSWQEKLSPGLSSCRNEGINEEGILFSLSP